MELPDRFGPLGRPDDYIAAASGDRRCRHQMRSLRGNIRGKKLVAAEFRVAKVRLLC